MKFDKVIMNPPYDIGGKIWNEVRHISENIICLMPLAQYKKNERYKYIKDFEVVDNTLFDAIISGNLCITSSQKEDNLKSYEDFLFESFDQRYRAFYEWNKKNIYLYFRNKNYHTYTEFNLNLDFAFKSRAPKDEHCVSSTGKGFDYYWNVLKKDFEDKWVKKIAIVHFESKKAKDNFTTFIYSKVGESLISKLFRGLHFIDQNIWVSYAIPQIDWNTISDNPLWKEGRYDEAVLDAMGLKWEGDKIVEI